MQPPPSPASSSVAFRTVCPSTPCELIYQSARRPQPRASCPSAWLHPAVLGSLPTSLLPPRSRSQFPRRASSNAGARSRNSCASYQTSSAAPSHSTSCQTLPSPHRSTGMPASQWVKLVGRQNGGGKKHVKKQHQHPPPEPFCSASWPESARVYGGVCVCLCVRLHAGCYLLRADVVTCSRAGEGARSRTLARKYAPRKYKKLAAWHCVALRGHVTSGLAV